PCSCIAALASSQRAGLASYGQLLANSASFHFARVDLITSLGPLGVFAVLLHILETHFTKINDPAPARLRTGRSNRTSGLLGLLWEASPKRRSGVFNKIYKLSYIDAQSLTRQKEFGNFSVVLALATQEC